MLRHRGHEGEAVEIRHHQIKNDDVVLDQPHLDHCFHSIRGFFDAIALALQDHPDQMSDSVVILYNKDPVTLRQGSLLLCRPAVCASKKWSDIKTKVLFRK